MDRERCKTCKYGCKTVSGRILCDKTIGHVYTDLLKECCLEEQEKSWEERQTIKPKIKEMKENNYFDNLAINFEQGLDNEIMIDKIDNNYYFYDEKYKCYIKISFSVGGERMINLALERENARNELEKLKKETRIKREERKKGD